MLDIMTICASMGLGEELEQVRKQRGEAAFNNQDVGIETDNETVNVMVESTASVLNAVESGVSAIADALIPSSSLLETSLPAMEMPCIDLTLPAAAKKEE